ncbi:DUF4190 domain-containing protein [Mycobacterium vicinigordonae]|uniref:DUF4190 domain-containing protein n=1 Tax=Mycobacterium vicinigordonae TaxID=1719132 RepID=A0A7D6E8H7_9MYCO|nr:DUF4190 domain-containing protein [Mycobacterium vicinigordonae]QLL09662.1 DUF4190 domain-containing protein [Mycobacterium vicinigordonae]
MTTIAPQRTAPAYSFGRPKPAKINGLAVVSLICGILQYFVLFLPCWLVTIPVGINALQQTRDDTGRRIAIAGLTLSLTHFAIYAFVFVWLLTTR